MVPSADRTRKASIVEAALEYFVSLLVTSAFLATICKRVGVSDAVTGIVSSIISLACVAQMFSGIVVKPKSSVKKAMMILSIINETMFATLYLIPYIHVPQELKITLFLVMILCAYLILNLITPIKYRWLNSFVANNERGRFTARKEIVSLVGGMIFTLIMGCVVDHFDKTGHSQTGFIICGVTLFLVALLHILTQFICDDEAPSDVPMTSPFKRMTESFLLIGRNSALRRLLIVDILWKTATYISTPYYGTYLIGELGFSLTFTSMLNILYSVTRAVVSPSFGRIADKKHWSALLTFSLCIAAVAFGINIFTRPGPMKWCYAVYYALYAISMAGINSGLYNITYDYIDISSFSDAMGARNAISGIVGFLASLLGSMLVKAIQDTGNRFLCLNIYAQQVNSAISFLLIIVLVLYMHFVISPIPRVNEEH